MLVKYIDKIMKMIWIINNLRFIYDYLYTNSQKEKKLLPIKLIYSKKILIFKKKLQTFIIVININIFLKIRFIMW